MLSDLKSVTIGVVVGMVATALLGLAVFFSLTARGPGLQSGQPSAPTVGIVQPAETPTLWATDTPTLGPAATFTPISTLVQLQGVSSMPTGSPRPTPDAVQLALDRGDLVFNGPLSNAEQIALYSTSLGYAQATAHDSRRVAVQINGVGYGDPSNICGPLAIAILRDAGLMTPDILPHDFWLLNPLAATDEQLLKRAFPSGRYIHALVATPLNKVDGRATPLMPGDFLFIWHGSWGNFDHMLVVNRVDSSQRAYAVTNYGTPGGYLIAEALLYDPADPTAGLFHEWTKERDAILGSTGFGGYELWRRASP